MNDPIVDEVRRVREAHAARFNYDLDAIFRDIKEQEKASGRNFVSFVPTKVESSGASQTNAVSVPIANGPPQPEAPRL